MQSAVSIRRLLLPPDQYRVDRSMNPIRPLLRASLPTARNLVASSSRCVTPWTRSLASATPPAHAKVSNIDIEVERVRSDPGEVEHGDAIASSTRDGEGVFIS